MSMLVGERRRRSYWRLIVLLLLLLLLVLRRRRVVLGIGSGLSGRRRRMCLLDKLLRLMVVVVIVVVVRVLEGYGARLGHARENRAVVGAERSERIRDRQEGWNRGWIAIARRFSGLSRNRWHGQRSRHWYLL